MYLVQRSDHNAFALDGALSQAHKLVLVGAPLHHSVTDMDAHGKAVALHAAGSVDCVPQETVARALHANHTGVSSTTVNACTSTGWAVTKGLLKMARGVVR